MQEDKNESELRALGVMLLIGCLLLASGGCTSKSASSLRDSENQQIRCSRERITPWNASSMEDLTAYKRSPRDLHQHSHSISRTKKRTAMGPRKTLKPTYPMTALT